MNSSSTTRLPRALALTLALAATAWGSAAHAVIFEAQGTIRSIQANANGTLTLVCGHVTTVVNAQTVIRTPVGPLTMAQLSSTTPFPASGFNAITGTARAGFVGGTCVAIGDDAIAPGQRTVVDLTVEIEENLLLGARTAGTAYNVNAVPVVALTDTRMSIVKPAAGFYNSNGTHPATATPLPGLIPPGGLINTAANVESARNEFGFGIDLASVPVGDLGAANGYYGSDGNFYAYSIETTAGNLLRTEPRPSIMRAQCRNDLTRPRDEIEIRGGCVLPNTATSAVVTVEGLLANGSVQTYGTATCTVAADAPANPNYKLGLYRFGSDTLTLTNNVCPSRVRARTTTGTVTRYDYADVDAR